MATNNKATKKCPHCKEKILRDARKCKHCSEWLEAKETKHGAKDVALRQPNEEIKKTSNGGLIGLIIILIIVFLFMSWPIRFMIFASLSSVALLIGLTEPDRFRKLIKKPTRKNIGLIFGIATLSFLILSVVTSPRNPTITLSDLNDSSKEVMAESFELKGKVSPVNSSLKLTKDNKTYIATSNLDKNGNFDYKLSLNEGDNNFSLTADNHGKTFSISKKLIRKLTQEEVSKKDVELKQKADEEEAKAEVAKELDAEVRFSSAAFMIKNKETQNWTSCKFVLNGKLFGSDFTYKTTTGINANDSIIISMNEFTKGDGTRFNSYSTKAKNLFISCDVEGNHRTGYYTISE